MTYRYSKPPSQRQLKVGENIRHIMAEIFIRNELNHPFFEKNTFTIAEVRISPDLKIATAFMIFPDNLEEKALLKFFKDLGPVFRKLVAAKIDLRYCPEIRFAGDQSIKKADKVEKLLMKMRSISEKSEE